MEQSARNKTSDIILSLFPCWSIKGVEGVEICRGGTHPCAGEVAVQGWCGGDVTIHGDSERVRRSPVVAPVEKITSSPVPRGDGPPPLLVSAGGCSPPESDPRRFVPPLGRHLHHL
ncbi:hypothetical protein GW17_00051595 [Ensete ventricosum]|nr:hypothetical protein GW17_00051595 [Ensete ventricosum]